MERITLFMMIAFGGALGAISRYLLSFYIQNKFITNFPIATITINAVGCLLLGMLLKIGMSSSVQEQFWRTFFIIGFLGSFTTFSTFASDVYDLFRNRESIYGLLYLLGSNMIGIVMIYVGTTLMRIFTTK